MAATAAAEARGQQPEHAAGDDSEHGASAQKAKPGKPLGNAEPSPALAAQKSADSGTGSDTTSEAGSPPGRGGNAPDAQAAWHVHSASGSDGLAWGILIGAISLGTGALTVRRRLPETAGRAPGATTGEAAASQRVRARGRLDSLVDQVRQRPYDGQARFELALTLFASGHDQHALNHLRRSFNTHPHGILRLLQEPALETIRARPGVDRVLRHYHRDQQRRIWTGYA